MKYRKQLAAGSALALAVSMGASSGALAATGNFPIGVEAGDDEQWAGIAMTNDDVVTTGVCIRTQADENSPAVGYLYRGGAVSIVFKGDEWSEVKSGNVKGFIRNEFLTFGTEAKGLAEYYGDYGVKASWNDVNVFSWDDPAASIVTQVDDGDTYPIVNNNGHWIEVQIGKDDTAYVSSDDVDMVILVDSAFGINEEGREEAAKASAAAVPASQAVAAAAETPQAAAAAAETPQAEAPAAAPAPAAEPVYEAPAAEPVYEAPAADSSTDASYDDGSAYSGADASYDDGSSYSGADASYDDGSAYSGTDASYDDGSYDDGASYNDGASYDDGSYDDGASYDDGSYDDGTSYDDVSFDDGSLDVPDEDAGYDETWDDGGDELYDDGGNDEVYDDENYDETWDDGSTGDDTDVTWDETFGDDYEGAAWEDGSDYAESYEEEGSWEEIPEADYDDSNAYDDSVSEESTAASTASGSDLDLLAAIIYCEAGNQPYDGMVAVGAVVMNRVASGSFPNTISEVIYQSGQFTPAYSGGLASALANGVPSGCYDAAGAALAGEDPTGGCLYFNTSHGSGVQIGAHWFY